jgi:hypothetical protein
VLLSLSPTGGEFPVNTFTTNGQTIPAVAADADGDFVVAWQSDGQDGSATGIYAQRFDAAGTRRGAAFLVNDTTFAGSQFRPAVAADADGDFVIAWDGGGGLPGTDSPGIFARRYDAAGVPQGAEFQVNTFIAGPQNSAAVAMDAAGNFVVAWQSRDQEAANDFGIYAQRYDAAGTAQGPEIHVNTVTGGAQTVATVAMDAGGDFVIAWVGADASFSGVRAQRFNAAGAPQGTEFPVNTTTASDQNFPTAAMDASGDFVIAWNSAGQDGSGNGVFAQRYYAGGVAQGGEFRANTFTTGDQENASAAIGADGDFLITWRSLGQDGASFGVYGKAYDAAGVARGGEFLVNTTTFGSQSGPAAAVDADGNAAVAWQSNPGDGNGEGVVAQRYDESDPDAAAPVVGGVFVNGARVAAPHSSLLGPLSQVVVSFSENVSDAGGASGPNSVANPANWLLTRDGAAQAPSITYGFNAAANRFEAVLALASPVASGNFFLKARDTLRDVAGNRLDGDFDGAAGGTLSLPFSVSQPGPRGGEFPVNTFANDDQRAPDVATDADGNFVVVWLGSGQDGLVNDIYAQRFSEAGVKLGPEFRVNSVVESSQVRHAVAMDADGDFVVAWDSDGQDGSGEGVYARRYSAGGLPQGGEFLVNTFTNRGQTSPAVAMSAGGAFVIAWNSEQDPGPGADPSGIYAQRYNASGVPQGDEFHVSSATASFQMTASAAMDRDGDFVITWNSYLQDLSGFGVYAQRYSASGAAQGGEFRVNTFTPGSQRGYRHVAMDDDGDFVVTWSGNGPTDDSGVYAKRFNAAGAAQGPEFRVNTFTTGSQARGSVAMDPLGNFLVTWDSEGQDGSGDGVYAQRYRLRGVPTVGTLADTPDPVTAGNSVTLTAGGAASPDGTVASVSFYRETNGEPGLQVGAEGDTPVGADTTPAGGFFSASASTTGLADGISTYWAQAADDLGLTGSPASTTNTVTGGTPVPPRVAAVFADSTVWINAFRQHLQNAGLGTAALGLRVPGAADQLLALPFNNVNRIRVQFSKHVTVDAADLAVRGVAVPTYAFAAGAAGFGYDPATFTATWTLAANVGRDKLRLDLNGDTTPAGPVADAAGNRLDGEWADGADAFPRGNGTAGGDFRFRLNVLPGDANGSGAVDVTDLGALATNFNQNPRSPRQGDFNGDAAVDVADLGILATNFNRGLPAGNPAVALSPARWPGRPFGATLIQPAPAAAAVRRLDELR